MIDTIALKEEKSGTLLSENEEGEAIDALKRRLKRKSQAFRKLLAKHRGVARRYLLQKHALERAARIQQSLLPVRPPSLHGYRFSHFYRPCEAVGGDFYDFVEREDGIVVILSDVIGHGFEAALATMLMKEIFEESVEVTTAPIELLAKMNARLHRALPEGMFAATAVLKLSWRCPNVQFSNAGLPYPYVLRAVQRRVDQIDVAGFPLGLFQEPAVPFQLRALCLVPGDVLLLSSDGISTVAGTRGDFFEDDRLPRLLSDLVGRTGEEVIETLTAEARRFGDGVPLPDDLNLLAITRE